MKGVDGSHWTQARSCPPQRLPDLLFQLTRTGTSVELQSSLGADIAPSTHTEG